jgi:CheY-like chemotaxis protein
MVAGSGAEAIELFSKDPLDVVVTDLRMKKRRRARRPRRRQARRSQVPVSS